MPEFMAVLAVEAYALFVIWFVTTGNAIHRSLEAIARQSSLIAGRLAPPAPPLEFEASFPETLSPAALLERIEAAGGRLRIVEDENG